jgi:hypothetical protein
VEKILIDIVVLVGGAVIVTTIHSATGILKFTSRLPVWKQFVLALSYMLWGAVIALL